MKISISKVLQSAGNGLQAEHAGEMLSMRVKLDLLQNYVQTPKTPMLPDQAAAQINVVTFHIVPSLAEHK